MDSRIFRLALPLAIVISASALLVTEARSGDPVARLDWSGTAIQGPELYRFGLFGEAPSGTLRLASPVERTTVRSSAQTYRAPAQTTTRSARLKALIAVAEVGALGYDAVHSGARRRPPAVPTAMTVGEILDWVRATPGQPHAIGRYQFVPATLRDLLRRTGVPASSRFTPELQDRLADVLLADAGFAGFQDGRLSRARFMDNLARIWAGLPLRTGRSAYHGYAGNAATITRARFEREMARIFD